MRVPAVVVALLLVAAAGAPLAADEREEAKKQVEFVWGARNRKEESQIGTATDWKLVAPGGNHTCALKNGGALYCWGWNGFG